MLPQRITQKSAIQLKINQPGCLYLKVQSERIDTAAASQFNDLVRRELTPSLAICSLHPQVAKVFKLTRLEEVFDIYATAKAALKEVSASPAFKADEH